MSGELLVGLVIGAALGLVVGIAVRQAKVVGAEERWAGARDEAAGRAKELEASKGELAEARAELARLAAELARLAAELEHEQRINTDRQQLVGSFAELSGEALKRNAEQFLTLADARMKEAQEAARGELARRQQAIGELLRPVQDTLAKYEENLRQLERERIGAYATLSEQVQHLSASNERLERETGNLVTALRTPQTRGRWGEMQLRRVVEMAGMVAHCDFSEQVSTSGDEGRFRPDVVVHLPGGAQVVVDAKVPLDAFLRSVEAESDEERKAQLVGHARQLRAHVDQLAKKQYWSQFDPSPEFVIAFVPGDPLLAAAFEHDPGLIEHAMDSRVLLATPTTLIALLRTVAFGWQQEALAENARVVQQLGSELYDRLRVMGSHLAKVQRNLSSTVEAFNDAVGSLESRVLVTARRFPELGVVGAGARELPELEPIVAAPRLPEVDREP